MLTKTRYQLVDNALTVLGATVFHSLSTAMPTQCFVFLTSLDLMRRQSKYHLLTRWFDRA